MQNSKKWSIPFRKGITLSKDQCPKTLEEEAHIRRVPYGSAVESLMYAILCTRPDICYILKYLNRTKNYMLVYFGEDLTPIGYTDSDFQSDKDSRK